MKVSHGMGRKPVRRERWRFVAGSVSLDFCNTVDWHAGAAPHESLDGYADLVRWCRAAAVIPRIRAEDLLREGRRRPVAAARVLRRAVVIREAIYRMAVAAAHGAAARPEDLALFSRALRSAFRHLRLVGDGSELTWAWADGPRRLDACLWPVLGSAAELLTSERRRRIRQCADDRGCGWLFLDTTKNRSRRWCDMADCGNRAKARRFAASRRRAARRVPSPGGSVPRGTGVRS